jgi:hypothetical protein
MILPLHLAYSTEFGNRKQRAAWSSEKSLQHMSRFDTDQKNHFDELAKKRKGEKKKY